MFEVSTYEEMVGVTMVSITADLSEMTFVAEDGTRFVFYHVQDCCESVRIGDIAGDLTDLVGSPLVVVEAAVNRPDVGDNESATWTFYRFATSKGWVTVRWIGESNGYYSESVDFRIERPDPASNE